MHSQNEARAPVDEHIRFQRATWIAERSAWVVFAVIIALTLAGAFSNGFLSFSHARQDDAGMSLDYQRFQRISLLTHFNIRLAEVAEEETRLRLDPKFQDVYEIERIEPRPSKSVAGENGLDLFFDTPLSGPLSIAIWMRPRKFGPVTLRMAGDRGNPLNFRIFIYP